MNQIIKRVLAAAMSLTLAASLLSGCTGASAVDPIKEMMGSESGITSETVMLTVNGDEITAGDIFFWLAQGAAETASYSEALGAEEVDWTSEAGEGVTLSDYVKNNAKDQAVLYNIVAAKAQEYGYEFTGEDKAAYEEELATAVEDLGGDAEYQNWLKCNCLTPAGMEKLSSVGVLFSHMQEGLFKDGGEFAPEAEDLTAYAAEQDFLRAKHILFLTQDMTTGTPLSEEEIKAKRATAEDLLAQLKAIQDPEELESTFDTMMNENSEDTGLADNPEGYTFLTGQMVPEFEEATRALEIGQVSDIVESDYGFHIILRLDPTQSDSLRAQWAEQKLNDMVDQWVNEAEIEETEAFTNLDIGDFYGKLTAYQDKLNAEAEAAEENTGEQTAESETEEAGTEVSESEETPAAETTEDSAQTEDSEAEAAPADQTEDGGTQEEEPAS